MNVRKIAVIGSFAAGAALALAPMAAADVTPDMTSAFDTEVASLNGIFQSDALLAGVPSTDYSVGPQGLDFINSGDVTTVQDNGTTPFDYLVYGVDPSAAGLSGDPGAATVFNGALSKFDDALNVELYALMNGGALDQNTGDFFGSASSIATGLGEGTATRAAEYFYDFGIGDLSGFFHTDLSFLDIPLT